MNKNCIVIFSKYPEAGKVKSRLASEIGKSHALDIYRLLVENTVTRCLELPDKLFLACTPGNSINRFRKWLGSRIGYFPQKGTDLGTRMASAFREVFQKGFTGAVLVGCDIPTLDRKTISESLHVLEEYDCVLGPAEDGGYYLIGFRNDTIDPGVFREINWGSSTVFKQTREIIRQLGLKCYTLSKKCDIDNICDLKNFMKSKCSSGFELYHFIKKYGLVDEI